MLMNPNSDGRCCCTKSICPLLRKRMASTSVCLSFFSHDIFRETVPGPLRLLFCYKSNSNNPVCVDATLLFHPQQMCLQACVNHDGGPGCPTWLLLNSRPPHGFCRLHQCACYSWRTALTFTLQKHSAHILSGGRTHGAQACCHSLFNGKLALAAFLESLFFFSFLLPH